jgi:hypothetical protein
MLGLVDFQKTAAQTCSSVPNRAGRGGARKKATTTSGRGSRAVLTEIYVMTTTTNEKVSVWGDTRTDANILVCIARASWKSLSTGILSSTRSVRYLVLYIPGIVVA